MVNFENPLVSIMMPTYNAEAFVAEAIDSVLSQNYKNIELLISDDASTDRTQEIIRSYEARDPRVLSTYNQVNVGIAKNCNSILKRLRGEFVCLFAGDDIMLASKISTQISYMLHNKNVVMSYHNVEIFDSDTNQRISITKPLIPFANAETIIEQMGIPGPMSIMIRTTALPTGFYNERYPYICDWLFQIETALRGDVGFIDEVLCRYRKHGVNNGKNLADYEKEFLEVLTHVEQNYKAPSLICAVKAGRARYSLGVAYRTLRTDRSLALRFSARSFMYDPKFKYLVAMLVFALLPAFVVDKLSAVYKKS